MFWGRAMTPNELITRFRRRYSQCDQTTALQLVNDIEEEILFSIPLRKSERVVALSAGAQHYTLAETDVRVWNAQCVRGPAIGDRSTLKEASVETWDAEQPGWRDSNPEWPSEYALEVRQNGGLAQGNLVLSRPSPASSLSIAGATNTTPIVVTTTTVHGLSDGDPVLVKGILGNEAANGRGFAKVSGYLATSFGLFADVGLTVGKEGSGAYTSGGIVITAARPGLLLDVSERIVYAGTETLPLTPMLRDLYVDGMCRLYAKERDKASFAYWDAIFTARLAEQQRMVVSRPVGVHPQVQPRVRQRPGWR